MKKIENDSLEGLEKGDNLPIIISKYGFKEETFGDKKFLVPMTKEEYVECIKNISDLSEEQKSTILENLENKMRSCYMQTDMYCYTPDGCSWCTYSNSGGYRFCYCRPM